VKQKAFDLHLPIYQPRSLKDDSAQKLFNALAPDLIVVVAYGKILPPWLVGFARLGSINLHGSLLPKYRGAAPVHRAVIGGESITGITIMRVVTQLDAGPMLATATRPIGRDDTSVDVERDLAEIGARLLLDVVDRLSQGPIVETPQDDRLATFAPKLEKTESPIDWALPARDIHNRVRGLQPWPMASTTIGGSRVLIHRTHVSEHTSHAQGGTIVDANGDALSVAAGDGTVLQVLVIQPEGRRAMTAREFLSGHKLHPGILLGRS
jgi:methionyl-tRNA formyltransferase